jgi:predicted transposase YdaD
MRESVTYQAIPREGREEGLERGRAEGEILGMRRAVLNLGTRKFGPPAATMTATLEQIADLAVLQRLTDSVLDASSWDELLASTID